MQYDAYFSLPCTLAIMSDWWDFIESALVQALVWIFVWAFTAPVKIVNACEPDSVVG